MHQKLGNALALALLSEGLAKVIIRRENDGSGTVVAHVCLITDSVLSESRLAQIQNLLRRTTAFDRELGACEHSVATAEAVSKNRCLVGALKIVNAANWRVRVIESLLSSIDQVIAKLQARVDHQNIVGGS